MRDELLAIVEKNSRIATKELAVLLGVQEIDIINELQKLQEEGKFVAFDLFFKVDKDTNIYLTPQSGITFADNDSGIKNASRIASIKGR